MPARTSDEKGVRPSVCQKYQTRALRQNGRKIKFFLYHTKAHFAQFSEQKSGRWGRPLLLEICGQPATVGAKSPILNYRQSLVAP